MNAIDFCRKYEQLGEVASELEAQKETVETYQHIMAIATPEHPVPYEIGMRVEKDVPYYCQSMSVAFTAKKSGTPYGLTDMEFFDFNHD